MRFLFSGSDIIKSMEIIYAALLGFVLDIFLGDPSWMPHPVVLMGRAISHMEKLLRRVFPGTPKGELRAGFFLAVSLPIISFALPFLLLYLSGLVHPGFRFALEVLWSWQVPALHGLVKESSHVEKALRQGTLEEAQKAVGRIVGRDTDQLSREGVIRAAVETVAENFSDGITAPLFYLLLGGAPLALAYKAVNTMDSMVGYKNDRYLYFGRCGAKLDDIVNWIPARLSAFFLILSAGLTGQNMKRAAGIWKRDRYRHASPNSAQTEAVMAGALGIQLAGPAFYFGRKHDKPTIGDDLRPIETGDIKRANRMIAVGSVLGLLIFCGIRWLVFR